MSDHVRVLRILEYTGTREEVEEAVSRSIQGTLEVGKRYGGKNKTLVIRAATIGTYPEILQVKPNEPAQPAQSSNTDILPDPNFAHLAK